MTKRLILIRHAKSDWSSVAQRDFDRPLNRRGHANAPEMAERLVKQGIVPDLIVSSPALRALTTATYFARAWNIAEQEMVLDKSIYEANVKDLLQVINGFDNTFSTIVLFGHNPGITDFVNYLTNAALDQMPTCGVVMLEMEVNDWAMVSMATGRVLLFDYPKS
ncbi:phosphohistidine phosphatase SixA [compost metagenome]